MVNKRNLSWEDKVTKAKKDSKRIKGSNRNLVSSTPKGYLKKSQLLKSIPDLVKEENKKYWERAVDCVTDEGTRKGSINLAVGMTSVYAKDSRMKELRKAEFILTIEKARKKGLVTIN